MTQLSVNVNKLATLRNSREKNLPDVVKFAAKILDYGAHGITVHPRPDGRHIRQHDVHEISAMIARRNRTHKPVEFNIEGFPSDEFIRMVIEVSPSQCTLVPDPPEALTSNAGWDLHKNEAFLAPVLKALAAKSIRVSLFVDPDSFDGAQAAALLRLKPNRIELYTEAYANHFDDSTREQVTSDYARVAEIAHQSGIDVNAGHDLNQKNLEYFLSNVPSIAEVSIGHALICEALEEGMETTIRNYLKIVAGK